MKKLISIVLVAMMLLSVLPLATFADEYYAGAAATTAPTADGTITAGEYLYSTNVLSNVTEKGDQGNGWIAYTHNPGSDYYFREGHSAQIFVGYDADYIYVALKVVDALDHPQMVIDINADPTSKETLYVLYSARSNAEHAKTAKRVTDTQVSTDLAWDDVIAASGASTAANGAMYDGVLELKIKRSAISDTAFDTIGLRVGVCTGGSGFYGEAYWGDDPTTSTIPYKVSGGWWLEQAGMHTLKLSEESGAPAPAPVSPTVDGVITAGEYDVTRTADIAEDTADYDWVADDTICAVDAPYSYGARKISYHYSVYGDYLYVAAVLETTGTSMLARFGISADESALAYSGAKMNQINPNGSTSKGADTTWEYEEAAATTTAEGGINTYVYEGKVALADLGTDLTTVYVKARVYTSGDGCINYNDVIVVNEPESDTESDTETEPAPTYDPYDLGEYGQITNYLGTASTPTVDGSVADGEYGWSASTTITDNVAAGSGFLVNEYGADSVTGVDLYAAYDANYIYLTAIISDAEPVGNDFCYFDVAVGNSMKTNNLDIYMPKYGIGALKGNTEVWLNGARADEYVASAVGSEANGKLCYEIALDRAKLETLAGESFDKFFFSFQYYLFAKTERGIFYGFEASELAGVVETATKYPVYSHVMVLGEESGSDTEAPAGEPIDLTQYGQHVIDLTEKNTPTVDGTIDSDEYKYSEGVATSTTIWGSDDIQATTYYFSYDEENLYIAAYVKDGAEHKEWQTGLFITVGGDPTDIDDAWRIFLTKAQGSAIEHWEIVDGVWGSNLFNSTDKGYKFRQSNVGSEYVYEIALNREDWGLTGDRVFFTAAVNSAAGSDFYGFANAELAGVYTHLQKITNFGTDYYVYPHMIKFSAVEPEPEPPVDIPDAVPADGLISENEYGWTSGSYDRNTEVPGEFYVITPHSDTVNHHAQWWLDYDAHYLYVAYKERSGYNTTARIDLSPNANADGKVSIEFSFDRVTANGANTGYDIQSVKVITYAANGTPTEVEVSDYVVSSVGSWWDDSSRNVNTVEFIISRSALAAYAGIDSFSTVGLRGYSFSQQSDPNDGWASKPAASMYATYGEGYHTIDLFDPHTCKTETWDDITAIIHRGSCDICGATIEENHTFGRERTLVEATCVAGGRIAKTCTICSYVYNRATEPNPDAHNYVDGVCTLCEAADPEAETTPVETEPAETEPVVTTPVETKPVETTPTETTPVETTPVVEEEKGCGSSIAALAVALVATLGTCVVFAGKKRD